VVTVTRQLEVANEGNVQLNHTLQNLGQGIDTLQTAGRTQVDLLQRTQLDGVARESRLAEVVALQNRRFTILWVGMLVALLLVACGLFVALRWRV
jgi:hypothetical protein